MNKQAFKNLQVGDTVTILRKTETYQGCKPSHVPAGKEGTIGATKVPCVHGKENSWFHCVDFGRNCRIAIFSNTQVL